MFVYVGGMPTDKLAVWSLEGEGKPAALVQEVDGLFSPSFLCRHPQLPRLYAAERQWSEADPSSGAVTTFSIERDSGRLTVVDRRRSQGAFTAHVNVSPDGRFLLVANPRGPTVALFPLDEAGCPQGAVQVVRHAGRGPLDRQAAPWPHSCYMDAANLRLFACDLGSDRVMIYDVDGATGALAPGAQPFAQVCSGAGARHMALNSGQGLAHVVNELDSTASTFRYDPAAGTLAIVQTISTVPAGFSGANLPAEILVDPTGRHVYVTNRGHDSIACFAVGAAGRLELIAHVPSRGETPRHIAMSPDGTLVAVSNQGAGAVRLFDRGANGLIEDRNQALPALNPTCAVIFS
ncbi:lactonase family protein [Caulobacter sp. LARHSG274]